MSFSQNTQFVSKKQRFVNGTSILKGGFEIKKIAS